MEVNGVSERINKVFRDIIYNRLKITTVRAEQQGAPLPKDPMFITVKVVFTGNTGRPEYLFSNNVDGDLDETIATRQPGQALINVYNKTACLDKDAFSVATAIKLYMSSEEAAQYRAQFDIGFQGVPEIRDVSAVENARYEQRAELTIDFNVALEMYLRTPTIEEFTITGSFIDGNKTYPIIINQQPTT